VKSQGTIGHGIRRRRGVILGLHITSDAGATSTGVAINIHRDRITLLQLDRLRGDIDYIGQVQVTPFEIQPLQSDFRLPQPFNSVAG
jgi:hypothetical protein